MFEQFHHIISPPHSFSSFFVTLIPKVDSLSQMGDIQLISLLGSLYKLMAKVLVGRLVGVMNKLIFSNQSNILKGRFLVDGVVDVNELVDLAKKSKNLASFLK